MQDLTEAARQRLEAIAGRHGVSPEAATGLLRALAAGGGTMAQFSHPELGGMGQWARGGMLMIGDMFNNALKARVDGLCTELAALLRDGDPFLPPPAAAPGHGQAQAAGRWWPAELGVPGSSGSQNDMRYACFPGAGRLAVQQGGRLRVYDTGGRTLYGVSQQQGAGQSLSFSSDQGTVRLEDLLPLDTPAAPMAAAPTPPPPAPAAASDIPALIGKLAALRDSGVLTEEEFTAKKRDLLSRL